MKNSNSTPRPLARVLSLAALALVVTLASAPVVAQDWSITGAACVASGGSIDLTVSANSGAAMQSSSQWRVFWDPAIFAFNSITFQSGWEGVANSLVMGEVYVASWHLPAYPTGASNIAIIRLDHIGGFGTPQITGEVEIWSDPALADIRPGTFAMIPKNVQITCGALPTCTITSPAPAAMVLGATTITYNLTHPGGLPLNVTYEFDAGAGFMPCARVGGGSSMDTGVMPGTGRTFNWDTNADFFLPDTGVRVRLTIVDAMMAGNTCEVTVDVDPDNQTPTCAITSPVPGQLIGTSHNVTFDVADAEGDAVDIVYEFNSGGGFMPASRVGGGSSMDTGVIPAAGLVFAWDIAADIPGSAMGVTFRISIDDNRLSGQSTCMVTFDVREPNQVPSCNILFPTSGATLMSMQSILFSTADGNGDPLDISYHFNAGAGFMPCTRVGGAPSVDIDVPPSGSLIFAWDIGADVRFSTMGVVFRISLDDGFGGLSTCMATYNINITMPRNDPPTCAITSPAGGSVVSGTQLITLDLDDNDGDPIDVTYQYDAGAGFVLATRVGGAPAMDVDVPAGTVGHTFDWNVAADVLAGTTNVVFRASLNDGFGGLATCTVTVNVSGGGTCPTPAQCGDCNNDTVITILDALAAAQIAVGVIMPSPTQFDRCNVQGALSPSPSAAVDILDALLMAQSAAGLPVALNCC